MIYNYQEIPEGLPVPHNKYDYGYEKRMMKWLKKLEPEEREELIVAMAGDKSLFARVCVPSIVREIPEFHYNLWNIHDRLSGSDASLTFAVTVLFRGAAKSTIKIISALHNIVYCIEKVQVFLSETEDQAQKDMIELQSYIESDIIKMIFGNLSGKNKTAKWTTTEAEFANGMYLVCKGWKSKIRGIRWKGSRPTLVYADDFEGESNSETVALRGKLQKWIDAAILPSGDVNFKIMFMGTIVHEEAYLATMKKLAFKKMAPFDEPDAIYYEETIAANYLGDNPAWGSRYNKKYIYKKYKYYKSVNRLWFFYQEYFNKPGKESEIKFDVTKLEEVDCTFHKLKNFCWIEMNNPYEDKPMKLPVYVYSGTDPNATTDEASDKFVHCTIAVTPSGYTLILDIFNEKIDIENHATTVHNLNDKFGVRRNTIETYSYQLALERYVQKIKLDRKGKYIIATFNENRSKTKKYITGILTPWNTGKIGYIKGCRNIDVLIEQAGSFSGSRSGKDDALDGLFLAMIDNIEPPEYDVDRQIRIIRNERRKKHNGIKDSWISL